MQGLLFKVMKIGSKPQVIRLENWADEIVAASDWQAL